MLPMSLPFRTQLITASAEDVATANATVDPAIGDGFLPTAEEARRVAAWTGANAADHARHWARHPDEAIVVLAAVTHVRDFSAEDRAAFVERALEDAAREGVAWTPVLDRLAAHQVWPGVSRIPAHVLPERIRNLTRPQAQVERLIPWLESEATAEELDEFLKFRAEQAWKLAARHARDLRTDQVGEMLEWFELARPLAQNPRAAQRHTRPLVAAARERMRSDHGAGKAVDVLRDLDEHPQPAISEEDYGALVDLLEDGTGARTGLRRFLLDSEHTPPTALARIVPDLSRIGEARKALFHSQSDATVWEAAFPPDSEEALLAVSIAHSDDVTDSQLRFLWERFQDSREFADGLAERESTPVWLLRGIADRHGDFALRKTLAANRTAVADPDVCAALLATTSTELLVAIAEHPETPAATFREIIERVAPEAPKAAAALLRGRTGRAPIDIRASSLVPLLNSDDSSVREVAVLALGDSSHESAEPPSRRR